MTNPDTQKNVFYLRIGSKKNFVSTYIVIGWCAFYIFILPIFFRDIIKSIKDVIHGILLISILLFLFITGLIRISYYLSWKMDVFIDNDFLYGSSYLLWGKRTYTYKIEMIKNINVKHKRSQMGIDMGGISVYEKKKFIISFDYNNKKIRFGTNLNSSEAEIIINEIKRRISNK